MTEQKKKVIGRPAVTGKDVLSRADAAGTKVDLAELQAIVERQAEAISKLTEKLNLNEEEEKKIVGLDRNKPFAKHCMVGGQYFEQGGKWYNAKGGEIPKPRIPR